MEITGVNEFGSICLKITILFFAPIDTAAAT